LTWAGFDVTATWAGAGVGVEELPELLLLCITMKVAAIRSAPRIPRRAGRGRAIALHIGSGWTDV
jgi:hypothetical protein